MLLLLLTSCFRGFISGQAKYQATEYIIDTPRIVALKTSAIEMVGGEPIIFDALLLAPEETEISDWKISACGLGNETTTFIWDFACFEDQEAISVLGQADTLPLSVAIPELPEINNCKEEDEQGEDDEEFSQDCYHYLPIRFEAMADNTPVFAAGFLNWYPTLEFERTQNNYDIPMGISAPQAARGGEQVALSFYMIPRPGAHNMAYSNFHWYIDAGELLYTGITATTDIIAPSPDFPQGKITSENELIIPEDYRGTLRIWVVVHQSWSEGLDMNWARWDIEVE